MASTSVEFAPVFCWRMQFDLRDRRAIGSAVQSAIHQEDDQAKEMA